MFTELEGSPEESYSSDGFQFTRRFRGPWEERLDFADQIIRFPYPNFPDVLVSGITFNPRGAMEEPDVSDRTFTTNTYPLCDAVVTYSVDFARGMGGGDQGRGRNKNREDNGDGSFFTYSANGEVELHTLKGKGLYWHGGSAENRRKIPSDFSSTLRTVITTHKLSWHRIQDVPWDLLQRNINKTNKEPFSMPVTGRTIEPEHLLLTGYSPSVEIDYSIFSNPTMAWKLDIEMQEKDSSWNKLWDDSRWIWSNVADAAGGIEYIYELSDFNEIFSKIRILGPE